MNNEKEFLQELDALVEKAIGDFEQYMYNKYAIEMNGEDEDQLEKLTEIFTLAMGYWLLEELKTGKLDYVFETAQEELLKNVKDILGEETLNKLQNDGKPIVIDQVPRHDTMMKEDRQA